MRICKTTRPVITALLASAPLVIGALPNQAQAEEPRNPVIVMTNEAMVATGACLAKYIARFDNASLEPAAVATRVAARCQDLISRSVGLATLLSGKPDDYAKNLEYMNGIFTTNAVVRTRAASLKRQNLLASARGATPRRVNPVGQE